MRALRWLPSLVFLLPWLLGPVVPEQETRLRDLTGASAFRLLDWETVHLGERVGRLWNGLFGDDRVRASDADTVRAYFVAVAGDQKAELRPEAEAALERLVANAYTEAGLTKSQPLPTNRLFPPLLVALTPPPNVLVIAPRTALRVLDSSVMQAMDVATEERLEASADSTGVSSLIAPIGGLATYPSMVLEEDAPDRVLASIAHEWLHQYLIFYPLGAGYWNSQETREINETTADMIGQEVGTSLAARLQLVAPTSEATSPRSPASASRPAFDFRAFVRDTRLQTEDLLSHGQVDAAETYMQTQRGVLQQHGYQIRKLNQAYFALYGSYGGGFAASPSSPIAGLLHTLRSRSPTLGDFVDEVRGITSVAQLRSVAEG